MGLFDKLTGKVNDFIDDVLLPDDMRTTLLRARRAFRDGDHTEALRLLDLLDEQKPGLTRSMELRGQTLISMGQSMEAAEVLRKAAAQRPEARLLLLLGLALEDAGELRTARDAMLQTLQSNPTDSLRVEVHGALGRIHMAMGRSDRAARELRKALRVLEGLRRNAGEEKEVPASTELEVDLAAALIGNDELSEARKVFDQAHPDGAVGESERSQRVASRLLMMEGRHTEALPITEELLALNPNDLELRFAAARAALKGGDPARAWQFLEGAMGQAKGDAVQVGQALMGRARLASGEPREALELLGRALETQSDDPELQGAIARAALELADAAETQAAAAALIGRAERGFSRQQVLLPEAGAPLHGLGLCAMRRLEWAEARRRLSQAREVEDTEDLRVDLAQCCLETRDPAAAIAVLTEGIAGHRTQEAGATLERAYRLLSPPLELPPADCRELARLEASLRKLRDWLLLTPSLISFLPDVQRALTAIDAPLNIAILGEFNAGKSTLVNAIIGEAIVPTGVLPTTAHINVLRFGPRRAAQLHSVDGEITEVPYKEVKKRIKADDRSRKIDHIEYLFPHPDLRRVHFWDTPGFNAIDPDHERHAQDALGRAEAIFWILDAGQTLADTEVQLIDTIDHAADRLVVVLNKIDRLGTGDERAQGTQTLVTRVEEHLGENVSAIFPISALEGLEARRDGDEVRLESSGLAGLLNYATEDVYERVALLKALDAAKALWALRLKMSQTIDALDAQLVDFQELLTKVEAGIEAEASVFRDDFLDEEVRRLGASMDALLAMVSLEITESLQPAPGLFGSLLTRTNLAQEDVEFIMDLLLERTDSMLEQSHRRTQQTLLDSEQRMIKGVESFSAAMPVTSAASMRSRLDGHLRQSQTLRSLLTEKVYGRYRAFVRGRLTAADAATIVKDSARRDSKSAEHSAALRQLLPDTHEFLVGELKSWSQDYFTAAKEFCKKSSADLKVMSIELRALKRGLNTE